MQDDRFLDTPRQSTVNYKSCFFRLKATEYDDLRGKLQAHIENVKNIVVRQSLSDLFLDDFRQYIAQNPKYRLPPNQQVD
jgi:E3 ubiquitin-protein ligase TM129